MSRFNVNKIMLILTFFFGMGFAAGRATAADFYPVVEYEHISDLFRGDAPWARQEPEPYHDSIMIGVSIVFSKKLEVDVLHGVKRLAGTAGNGTPEGGTIFRVRWYPWTRR